jgi:DNA-binding LacI/PurR family transcriptional regulator
LFSETGLHTTVEDMPESPILGKSRRKMPAVPRVRTTLKAVAERAGVSKGLASRVLNGGSTTIPISEETIRRVRQAATDLRYIPSRMARSLSKGARSHIIGLSLVAPQRLNGDPKPSREGSPQLPERYQNPLINEVVKIQQCHDVGILVNEIAMDEHLCGRWDVVVRHRKEHLDHPFTPLDLGLDLVEGLIYTQPSTRHTEILDLARSGIPVVLLGHVVHGEDVCSVGIDNRLAGERLAKHLIEQGRRHLVGLWPFSRESSLAVMRSTGFRAALSSRGMESLDEFFVGMWPDSACGYWQMREIIEDYPDLDGVVVGTNQLARGVAYAIEESGRHIPDDVALVTFDDNIFNVFEPPHLTALRVPVDEMICLALKQLTQMIEGHAPETLHHFVVPELVIRQSCGASSAGEGYHYTEEEEDHHVVANLSI